jgi:glycyl-tRNA synthetase
MHPKVPFGIAQIGKAFRNEISPRNFLFRTREFEQADTQYFVRPESADEIYNRIKQERWDWYLGLGIQAENLRWSQHKNLVFYAKDAWDIEYNFPSYGFDEVEGIHNRSDYDLSVHSEASGTDLSYIDQDSAERYKPYVLETSAGLGRIFLAVLSEAYTVEEMDGAERTVLKLNPQLAPVKVAVLPLMKNKPELVDKAREVFAMLSKNIVCEYAETGTVGKRYRKQDEVGTPHCVTIDFDTLEDDAVTVRDRDSGEQKRVKIAELLKVLV